MPAQHASRSMAPKRSTAPRISASMSPARDTSATLPSTAPSPRSSREACSTLGASFEQKTTLAPPRARRSTVARPIPVEPPVTTATFPRKSKGSLTTTSFPARGGTFSFRDTVTRSHPPVLALTKLRRNGQRDREDVLRLANAVPLDIETLRARYQGMRPCLGNPEREDLTLSSGSRSFQETRKGNS